MNQSTCTETVIPPSLQQCKNKYKPCLILAMYWC